MSEIKAIKCDKCGAQSPDPEAWEFIPVQLEAGVRHEEGWSIRSGHLCDECAQEVLPAVRQMLKIIPLTVGRPGGTALLACEGDPDSYN